MLSVTSYHGNAKPEIPTHTCQNGCYKKHKIEGHIF